MYKRQVVGVKTTVPSSWMDGWMDGWIDYLGLPLHPSAPSELPHIVNQFAVHLLLVSATHTQTLHVSIDNNSSVIILFFVLSFLLHKSAFRLQFFVQKAVLSVRSPSLFSLFDPHFLNRNTCFIRHLTHLRN